MVKATDCKTLKINPEQAAIIEEIISLGYSSREEFGKALSAAGERMKHVNYYMYKHNFEKYLIGKIPLSARPARAMLETLGTDGRLSFLREIAEQKLCGDK